MAVGPLVVGVSELRRRLADLIFQVERGEHPLFITQHGCVSAVLISKKQYRDWCPDGESRRHEGQPGHEGQPRREGQCGGADNSRWPAVPAPTGEHRRRPGFTVVPTRKVWTQYGWCDFEVAQVLAEQGAETELIPTDEGWFTDDEG
jgi:prevent-host-death family protein